VKPVENEILYFDSSGCGKKRKRMTLSDMTFTVMEKEMREKNQTLSQSLA
jgi:hypothetical protein